MKEPLPLKLWRHCSPVADLTLVAAMIVLAWGVLRHSPICSPNKPHWASDRYIVAALLAAGSYVLLSGAAGLYRFPCPVPPERVPLLNLLTTLVLLALTWLTCLRYAAMNEGATLISRRVLFFGLVVAYMLTSLHHYARLSLARPRTSP